MRGIGLLGALIAVSGFASVGCVRGPDVESGLGLKRIVIYRNGVGYYERQGKVDAEEVTFKVRHEKVGDFLATLAVIEQGGSSVRSASFPVGVDKKDGDDDADEDGGNKRYEVLLKPPPDKQKKGEKLETVKLALDGKEHDLTIGYVAETPVWRPSYRLVIDLKDPKATSADLQAWGIVQNLSGEDWKGVKLSLVAGAPLAFQATLEKAVIPERPIVTDQGEVIASVPMGETSLQQGPLPAEPAPVVTPAAAESRHTLDGLLREEKEMDEDDASYKQPIGGLAKDKAKRGPGGGGAGRSAASAAPKPSKKLAKNEASKADSGRYRAYDAPGAPVPPPPPPPPRNPSPPRDVRSLAAVAMESGSTRYDLPFPVDVPNNSATMVMLLSKKVPGESIFLFAPDGGVSDSISHPFRVARFTNNTPGLLERGPIAVFANGAFLGQGMVDPLPPGATATVPFALERSLAVDQARQENEQGARIAQIEAGVLEIERDWVTHTKYTVKNGSDDNAKVLVKHPRSYGTKLFDPPKGTEDNIGTGSALVPVEVKGRATAILDVDERRALRRRVDWLEPLADEAVKAYLADGKSDQAVIAQLKPAWEARTKLRTSLDEKDKLDLEANQLRIQSDELARNIKAIEKNKSADQLRKDLTDRLSKASARLDEITKRTIVLEMQIKEQSIRFRDLVLAIKKV
jgi:hypothetical protein